MTPLPSTWLFHPSHLLIPSRTRLSTRLRVECGRIGCLQCRRGKTLWSRTLLWRQATRSQQKSLLPWSKLTSCPFTDGVLSGSIAGGGGAGLSMVASPLSMVPAYLPACNVTCCPVPYRSACPVTQAREGKHTTVAIGPSNTGKRRGGWVGEGGGRLGRNTRLTDTKPQR